MYSGSKTIGLFALGSGEWKIDRFRGNIIDTDSNDTKESLVMHYKSNTFKNCTNEYKSPTSSVEVVDLGRVVGKDENDKGALLLVKTIRRNKPPTEENNRYVKVTFIHEFIKRVLM